MKHLPSLNGLRAISVTIVILYHFIRFSIDVNPDIYLHFPIFDGQFGVNVFFVISGFLITSLLLKEEEDFGRISLKGFYTRRTLRIFPAYFFMLLVYWVLQLLGFLHIPHQSWLTSLTYTKYINYRIDWYTAHTWSLSIEENFYLLWPAIFLLGKKARENAAMFLIFIVPIIRTYLNANPVDWINDLSFFTRIDSIAMGCFFALNRQEIIDRLSLHWKKAFYLSLVILFLLPWVADWAKQSGWGFIFIALGVLHGSIANVLIAVVMMYSVFGPKGVWHKTLNSRVFNYVGVLSYSLYLWQQLYISQRSWWITHFPQNIILIFLTAMFSYYIIEKPFLKLKSRFSSKKRTITKDFPVATSQLNAQPEK